MIILQCDKEKFENGVKMVKIVLYAQPLGSEPYLNMSTFGAVDSEDAGQQENIKALTDIGRFVCETAQVMDEEASIAGTSMKGSSYEWGLRIEMRNLTIDMISESYTSEPLTVKDHLIRLDMNGKEPVIEEFIHNLVNVLERSPFQMNDWNKFMKSKKVSKENVINSWKKFLGEIPDEELPIEVGAPEQIAEVSELDELVPVEPSVVEPVEPEMYHEEAEPPVMAKKKRKVRLKVKKKEQGTSSRPCPKCKTIVSIDPSQDPIIFKCPNCGLRGKFKRKKKMKPKLKQKPLTEPTAPPEELPEAEIVAKPETVSEPKPEPEPVQEPTPEPEPELRPEKDEPVLEPKRKVKPVVKPVEEPKPEKEPKPEPEPEKEPEPKLEPVKEPEVPQKSDTDRIIEYIEKAEEFKNRNMYHDAVRYYDMVLDLDPENIQALNNKGIILWANKKYKLAIEHFDRVLGLDKTNEEAMINKAASLNKLGEKEGALDTYTQLLDANKTNSDAWSNKGVLLYTLQRYEEAEECFRSAVDLDDDDEDSWFNLAIVLEKNNKFEPAAEAYDKVIALNPKNEDAYRGRQDCMKEVRREMLKDWER
jgi:Tfp pilus assembly protein PilF